MQTRVCDMLGIEFPILAFSHCRDVVAAVSKAGGLGVLGVTAHTPKQLEIDCEWIENEIGPNRGYGIDVLIPAKYTGSDEGGLTRERLAPMIPAEHREFIDELLARYDVPPLPEGERTNSGEGTWSHKGAQPLVDIALAHRIRLIVNALGPAPVELVTQAHESNVLVAGLVGTKVHAQRQMNNGVDIIVAQGYEAGGHTGEIATMVLIPEVVDAVGNTPVLAAGGISRGRQMAAAMALGAQGVWTGSVWLTTEEAETHPVVKQKFLTASSSDTVRSRASTGKPARQLRTAWTEEWEAEANPKPLGMPLHGMLIAEAQQRIHRSAMTPGSGAEKLVNYFVGQVVGNMNQIKPARQVVFEMVDEYLDVVGGLARGLEVSGS
jgi:NAD(P)H-dependent flavin oxidoreductase YrpB (nitropropane dioxygenase family)